MLLFLSKSPSGHATYRPNARIVLEMRNFTPAYMNVGTYGRMNRRFCRDKNFLDA